MTVESASYIDDLVSSNPSASDYLYEGDDHIKLIKAVLLASFPNIGAAVTATAAELNTVIGASGTLLSTGTAGQWVQLGTGTVSGTPTVLDFVNGTAGVVISAAYDQYLITFSNLKATDGAGVLQIQCSEDAGVTFPANASGCNWQVDTIAAGASTITQASSQPYVRFGGATATPSTDPGASGQILIHRPLSGDLRCAVFADILIGTATRVSTVGVLGCTAAQFDALRLLMSSSTFAGSNARVRLHGRKV